MSEERLSRIKNHSGYYHGFPDRSIAAAFATTGWDVGVDRRHRGFELRLPAAAAAPARAHAEPARRREGVPRPARVQPDAVNSRLYSVFSERPSNSALAHGSIAVYRVVLAGSSAPSSVSPPRSSSSTTTVATPRPPTSRRPRTTAWCVTLDCHGDGLSGTVSVPPGAGRCARRDVPRDRLARLLLRGDHQPPGLPSPSPRGEGDRTRGLRRSAGRPRRRAGG